MICELHNKFWKVFFWILGISKDYTRDREVSLGAVIIDLFITTIFIVGMITIPRFVIASTIVLMIFIRIIKFSQKSNILNHKFVCKKVGK